MTDEERVKYELELDRLRYQRELAAEQAEEQSKQKQAKMGWGIFLIALLLSLVADAIELFTLGTIGWLVGLFIDLILFLMLGFTAAGRKQFKKWIWGPLIEKIPFLNTIPFIRAGFLIWSFVSSRSQLVQKVGTAAKIL
ncbi:MAG: hypothetical protein AAB585_02685 [Patescibacteria group bacterium]